MFQFEKMTALVDSWDAWRRDIDGTTCDSIADADVRAQYYTESRRRVRDAALKFPSISQLELWDGGVFVIVRASTRCRDAVGPT